MRRYYVSYARYAYRGELVAVNGCIHTLKNNAQIIDLGNGTSAPKEEIVFPDGMEVDVSKCEMNVPEPAAWGWKTTSHG